MTEQQPKTADIDASEGFSRWRYWWRFHLPSVAYLFVLVVITAGSYWWVTNETAEPEVEKVAHPELVDAFASGMQINRTGADGKVSYAIIAKTVAHFGDQNADLVDVTVVSTPIGQAPSTTTADTAVWHGETHVVDLKGHVVMDRLATPVSPNMHLTTDAMSIDVNENLATSDLPFVFTQAEDKIEGKKFRYDYGLRNIELGDKGERVKATLQNVKTSMTP